MFNFAWTEIALIVVVALIFIGPKDLPVAIKTITQLIKKARRMAGEFQTHVDELVREANLDEVRNQINEIRNFDFKGEVERTVDPDGSLRGSMASSANPFDPATYTTPAATEATPSEAASGEHAVDERGAPVIDRPDEAQDAAPAATVSDAPAAPAFIPPALVPRPSPEPVVVADVPAFVPPAYALNRPPT
ncbi:MAG: twin-arginine translocase subunit TatB [Proteobacteria bacterium]|nr:twin-arginine translocase subunit TatB [Pseudomonadota bacterium]